MHKCPKSPNSFSYRFNILLHIWWWWADIFRAWSLQTIPHISTFPLEKTRSRPIKYPYHCRIRRCQVVDQIVELYEGKSIYWNLTSRICDFATLSLKVSRGWLCAKHPYFSKQIPHQYFFHKYNLSKDYKYISQIYICWLFFVVLFKM